MVRFYWYGISVIYLACCAIGMAVGYSWGIGGSLVGAVIGAMAATGVATVLNTAERMENAFYAILSVTFIVALGWLIVSFWGVQL